MKKIHLYSIVALDGAAILAIEIFGVRILRPFYGESLFLWSAFITVTLAALSSGYMLGGRWADRSTSTMRLNWILLLAGCWLIFIPFLKVVVLLLTDLFGFRLTVLIAALILFFPPLTLLGMVTPYAIKLITKSLMEVGRSTGNIFAISIMGGVFSALVINFLLIPNFRITRLILAIGLILILTALAGFWIDRENHKKTVSISIILFFSGLFLIWQMPLAKINKEKGQLFIQQSSFGEISVVDKDEVRYLLIDGAVHSSVRDSTLDQLQQYGIVIDLCKELFFRPGKMLLIGLGSGSIVRDFIKDSWAVEVVEIDPVLIDIAQRFFDLDTTRCQIYEGDGRQFLRQNLNQYDFIVLDAYIGSSLPFHLISREMFKLISSHLDKNGVLAINIKAVGWDATLIKSIAITLRQSFQTVLALPTSEPPNTLGHVVLLGANRRLEIEDEVLGHPSDYVNLDSYIHWVVVQRNHAWDNRYEPDAVNAKMITDEFNPVELWAETINLAVRQKMKETFDMNAYSY